VTGVQTCALPILRVNRHLLRAARRVAPTTALMADLKALLGPSAVGG